MAAREMHGVIENDLFSTIHWVRDECDSGQWQDPWYPSKSAGTIAPAEQREWRSESDGILTGTSGWALWKVNVMSGADGPHDEFFRVNWSVPMAGGPNITCAAWRNDPDDTFPDPRPSLITIVPIFRSEDGTEGALVQAAEIAPYVLAVPWSFWADAPQFQTHPRQIFSVRLRAQTQSALITPDMVGEPDMGQLAMVAFRQRAEYAAANGFAGGFPNFYEANSGPDRVGGSIFLNSSVAEWRDVSLHDLGNPPLEDFGERMRATNAYATKNGYIGGFPTYYHAQYSEGIVCGSVFLRGEGVEWRDVPIADLGNPPLDDIGQRFRATQDYAKRYGFEGGFPNMFHADYGNGIVCGTLLLKAPAATRRDIVIFRGPH
ncbi:hypothetical protein [Burkholderia sp. JP2-270]|uniref:hypothetical protein n=1 Tax=Burkholderia sp. JP2-270 TaxID=2217913 RepID=UPI0013A6AB81|nr:hypothetical protein [Burkholderia sp. JP2-270]